MTLTFTENFEMNNINGESMVMNSGYITIKRGEHVYGFLDENKKCLLKFCKGNMMKIQFSLAKYF